jgi:hypothetical protein
MRSEPTLRYRSPGKEKDGGLEVVMMTWSRSSFVSLRLKWNPMTNRVKVMDFHEMNTASDIQPSKCSEARNIV